MHQLVLIATNMQPVRLRHFVLVNECGLIYDALPCHGYKEPIPFKANFVLLHHNISPIKNTSTNLQV